MSKVFDDIASETRPYLLTESELGALSTGLHRIIVRPMPLTVDALSDPKVQVLEASLSCDYVKTEDGSERIFSCSVHSSDTGATGWKGNLTDNATSVMQATLACSMDHSIARSESDHAFVIPCALSTTALTDTDASSPYSKANWSDALREAFRAAILGVIQCETDDLPLPFDKPTCLKQRLENMTCGDHPYVASDWTECTATCGGGTQWREKADNTRETRSCNVQPCCSYGACQPTSGAVCSITYTDKDGKSHTVTASSPLDDIRAAMFYLNQPSGTVITGGTMTGARQGLATPCDTEGRFPQPPLCSINPSACDPKGKPCELPCSIELPTPVDPGQPLDDFPANEEETMCAALRLAAMSLCAVDGSTGGPGCVDLGSDPSIALAACRGVTGPTHTFVPNPPPSKICNLRTIDVGTVDGILERVDKVVQSAASGGGPQVKGDDLMWDVRCCNDLRLGDMFKGAPGCDPEQNVSSSKISSSLAITAKVQSTK